MSDETTPARFRSKFWDDLAEGMKDPEFRRAFEEQQAEMLAQLPPDGQGRWRQGTKNPRNLYVHQGDDETGQPVGQLYSAELAALVCDAVNAQQARGEA
jgi:hypothetical protein